MEVPIALLIVLGGAVLFLAVGAFLLGRGRRGGRRFLPSSRPRVT